MLQQLPNVLTASRLLLALPLGLLILREQYDWALAVGAFAGLTDALDGFAARRLQAFSRLGSILDPIADKTLILVAFLCFAANELVPVYLAAIVIGRDIVIAAGAATYHLLIGAFDFAARGLSKCNMVVQIAFCIVVLVNQLTALPAWLFGASSVVVIGIAIASGVDYVVAWTLRAVRINMQSGRGD
jgi:cardiolipin synthase